MSHSLVPPAARIDEEPKLEDEGQGDELEEALWPRSPGGNFFHEKNNNNNTKGEGHL